MPIKTFTHPIVMVRQVQGIFLFYLFSGVLTVSSFVLIEQEHGMLADTECNCHW